MAQTTTLTLRLPKHIGAKLERLAEQSNTNARLLGAEAVSQFVTRELAIVDAIKAGRADVQAGRIIPHGEVQRDVEELISAARPGR